MIDLGRITEAVGGLFGQATQDGGGEGLLQQLTEAGLDPSQLAELAPQDLLDVLSSHGIDPSQLDMAELGDLLGQDGAIGAIGDLLGQFTNRSG